MKRKKPIEIAVEGIGGAGKSTLIECAVNDLRHRGFKVASIDVSNFQLISDGKHTNAIFRFLIEKAEKFHSTFLFVLLGWCAALYYLFLRWSVRNFDVVLTERHPIIDTVVYARLYGGVFSAFVAKYLLMLWPQPNAILMLTTSPKIAFERSIKRGLVLRPHETVSVLYTLALFLRKQTEKFRECFFSEDNTLENFHEFLYERRILAL